jgi:glutaredoxin 3
VASIEIYTKVTCPYCVRARRLLEIKKVPFREIAVDRGGSPKEEMVQRANGRTTVPQIFIGTVHVGGSDDLHELDYEGRLDPLLAGEGNHA